MISIIAAVSDNGVVGDKNTLPWARRVPRDMKHFVEQTKHGIVVMGRNTFESMGSVPLKNRANIVVSSKLKAEDNTITVVTNLNDALSHALKLSLSQDPQPKVFVIGGTNIWKEAMQSEFVERALITRIRETFEGDTSFPEEDLKKGYSLFYKTEWKEVDPTLLSSTFEVWKRK